MSKAPLPRTNLFLALVKDARRYHRHYRDQPDHRWIASRRLEKLEETNLRISVHQQDRGVDLELVGRPGRAELDRAIEGLTKYYGTRAVSWRIDRVDLLRGRAVSREEFGAAIFACSERARSEAYWNGPGMRCLDATLAALYLLEVLAHEGGMPAEIRGHLRTLAAAALNVPE